MKKMLLTILTITMLGALMCSCGGNDKTGTATGTTFIPNPMVESSYAELKAKYEIDLPLLNGAKNVKYFIITGTSLGEVQFQIGGDKYSVRGTRKDLNDPQSMAGVYYEFPKTDKFAYDGCEVTVWYGGGKGAGLCATWRRAFDRYSLYSSALKDTDLEAFELTVKALIDKQYR